MNKLMNKLMITGTLSALLIMSGCSGPMNNEDFIAESAMCEENGFVAHTHRSTWDSDIIGVECVPPRPSWKPRVNEFTLDDGTRCISVSTRATNFPKDSGFSGLACDWKPEEVSE